MRITMIGHSTVLIETDGKKILTDIGESGEIWLMRVSVFLQSHAKN
jgi:hypothetical protein